MKAENLGTVLAWTVSLRFFMPVGQSSFV